MPQSKMIRNYTSRSEGAIQDKRQRMSHGVLSLYLLEIGPETVMACYS